jgi:hypothetical protein
VVRGGVGEQEKWEQMTLNHYLYISDPYLCALERAIVTRQETR